MTPAHYLQHLDSPPHDDPAQLDAFALLAGVPAFDLKASPFTVRASLLGLATGCAFTHHERRVRIPTTPESAPERPVWHHPDTLPVWEGGVLTEPKYFSFFQDAPLPSYNPNHRSKWRAHELLHAAVGFYYSPSQTRFDAYLGARLGELLPVVHWYGFDEIRRPRCPDHTHGDPPKHTCSRCEDLARGLEAGGVLPTASQDLALMQSALEHFDSELAAIQQELSTRRVVRTPHARLDASSDAIGYLHGHWPRQSAWSMGAWVEMFCARGEDYLDEPQAYATRICAQREALLTGSLTLSHQDYMRRRQRRVLQDFGARALRAAQHGEQGARTRVCALLQPLAARAQELLRPEATPHAQDHELVEQMLAGIEAISELPVAITERVRGAGHSMLTQELTRVEVEQCSLGVETCAPVSAIALTGAHVSLEEVTALLMENEVIFLQPVPLVQRLTTLLSSQADETIQLIARLAAIEGWLTAAPHQDEEADAFGMIPHHPDELHTGTLRLGATARRGTFSVDLLAAALEQGGEEEGEQAQVEIVAMIRDGEMSVFEVDEGVQMWWELATDPSAPRAPERMREHWERGQELFLEGVLVWLP